MCTYIKFITKPKETILGFIKSVAIPHTQYIRLQKSANDLKNIIDLNSQWHFRAITSSNDPHV